MVFSPFPNYHDPDSNGQQQQLLHQQQVAVVESHRIASDEGGGSSRMRGSGGADRAVSMREQARRENIGRPAQANCPRCGSANTKFCYYNNRSLYQPRYWCRSCRRHWTHGGAFRPIPSGGNRRGTRRPTRSSSSSSAVAPTVAHEQLGMEAYYDAFGYYSVLPQFQFGFEPELPSFHIGDVDPGFNGLDENIGHHGFGNPN